MADNQTRKFVVGLGNPGREYAGTRHNAGFMVLEALRRRWKADDAGRRAFSGRMYEAHPGQARVIMLEPHTYMNCSGQAVREMMQFYQAAEGDLLVVLDDMALPVGRLRMRAEGSAGGHNGLADIIAALGTSGVQRLRIGIGSPPAGPPWRDYVLSRFRPEELEAIGSAVEKAAAAVEDWVFRGTQYVMDRYNRDPDSDGT